MTVTVDIVAGVATITLDSPSRRNAISPGMAERFHQVLDAIEADDTVRATVVTGRGVAFCAGADLGQTASTDGAAAVIYEIFHRLVEFPTPTIAAVNGTAVGAGVNLALACDTRIASRSARFDSRFLKLGLHPGGGHSWLTHRAAGLQATFATVLFGEVVDGPEAERVGLVWRCVEDDELMPAARELANAAAGVSRELLSRTKATIRGVTELSGHEQSVAVEAAEQEWSVQQPAFQLTLGALKEKPVN
jgi:enoyl-CoA hydratase